jgi:hypothetical protein
MYIIWDRPNNAWLEKTRTIQHVDFLNAVTLTRNLVTCLRLTSGGTPWDDAFVLVGDVDRMPRRFQRQCSPAHVGFDEVDHPAEPGSG